MDILDDSEVSSYESYIKAITLQISTRAGRAFFISCFLSNESSENLNHDQDFIHVLVDIVGEGVEHDRMQPQKRVEVKEISLKKLHEDLEDQVGREQAEEIRKFRKDGERRGSAAFGLTIEFKVHYPNNKVSFGVHGEFLIEEKIFPGVSKAPEYEETTELRSRLAESSDPTPLWKARIFNGLSDSVNGWEVTTKIHDKANPDNSPDRFIPESTSQSKSQSSRPSSPLLRLLERFTGKGKK